MFPAGGPPGDMLLELLDKEGVEHQRVKIDGWTRENLMVYDETADQQFRFGMPGPEIGEWKSCLEALAHTRPKPAYIVASGSLPRGVPEDFYAMVADIAKELNSKLILDTSGQALQKAVHSGIYMIKPNLREFRNLSGEDLESEEQQKEFARDLIERGHCQIIMVSLGAGGAMLVWKDGYEKLGAPTVKIRSKVGAGDSMVAGMVLSLARNRPLPEAARFAIAAGAAAVMTPGSELCRREDAERLYKSISVYDSAA